MDDIEKAQYENLRKCFNDNLVKPILGENYYNMGNDVYQSDKLTTEHIKYRYDSLKLDVQFYKGTSTITWIFIIFIIIAYTIIKIKGGNI